MKQKAFLKTHHFTRTHMKRLDSEKCENIKAGNNI
jgi:hypothetical protein